VARCHQLGNNEFTDLFVIFHQEHIHAHHPLQR
jgi:hypothetical protein